MLLNEASTLRAADMTLSGAATASQPKAGFQVTLGLIDAPTVAPSLSNAELMKSTGLFGRVKRAIVTERALWQTPEQALQNMSEAQPQNLNCFLKKMSANSENIRVKDFLNGGKVFQAD
jgi:hypothetical protein